MAKSADDPKDAPKKASATGKKSAAELSRSGDPSKRATAEAAAAEAEATQRHKAKAQRVGNPPWFVPVMLGLMVVGLLWVVTFYLTGQQYPVPSWGMWNLGAGFALILVGFGMTTRWK